jgi:hypothetical protein
MHSDKADDTKIGAICQGRYVTHLDQEFWKKSREKRKKKRFILDDYRY